MAKYFFLLLIIVGYCGCSKKTISPEQSFDYDNFNGSTDLVTHISINKYILTDTINKTLDGFTSEVFNIDEYDVDIVIKRSADVKINVLNKAILFEIPLKIVVVKSTMFGPISGEGEILFKVASLINISEDWKLTTESELLDHTWIVKPKLNFGISIPAKHLSDIVIKQVAPILLSNIDQSISDEVDLAGTIKGVVKDFEEPYQMKDQYDFWYTPRVNSISLGYFTDEAYQIKSTLNITATNLVHTSFPKISTPELPPFSWLQVPKDSSEVAIVFDLNYVQINEILEDLYKGMIIEESGKTIEIVGVSVGSHNGLLSVYCLLKGDYNGGIRLEGLPYFDYSDRSLSVNQINVKFDTKNILAKGAGWLLKGRMKRELSELLHIPLADYATNLQEAIDLELLNYQKENYIYLYAKLGSFEISGLNFSRDKIQGKLQFKAYLSSHLNDIRFFR